MKSPASPAQLLVEGTDPYHVFRTFCKSWRLSGIEVRNFGGITELKGYLDGFVRTPGFSNVARVGIIRDAEKRADSAFLSVSGALKNAGLGVPERPGEPSNSFPSISVLILPDGASPGNLESLLWESVRSDPEAPCIRDFLECLGTIDGVTITRADKARVNAYLSGKPHPSVSVGVAARKGYWNSGHNAFSEVRSFLTNLNSGISTSDTDDTTRDDSGYPGESR